MFTGIVSAIGRIEALQPDGNVLRARIAAKLGSPVEIGASVAFSGICLTITEFAAGEGGTTLLSVDLGPETLRATTAGTWRPGTRINIERALRMGDELGGHLVTGHIDGIATVVARETFAETAAYRFAAPAELARFIAAKGSVTLDGTSLTVNDVDGAEFECHLIPHTLAVTTWPDRDVGDGVNLEVDLIARYAERLLAAR